MATDFSPSPVVAAHWQSVRGARVAYALVPLLAGGTVYVLAPHSPSATGEACLAISAVMAALFMQMSAQISARAADWANDPPPAGPNTSAEADEVERLAANAAYGTLVSFLAVIPAFAVSITDSGKPQRFGLAALALTMTHLGHTVLLATMRGYLASVTATREVRSGARQRRSRSNDLADH